MKIVLPPIDPRALMIRIAKRLGNPNACRNCGQVHNMAPCAPRSPSPREMSVVETPVIGTVAIQTAA